MKRPRMRSEPLKAPSVGSLFYEIGFKDKFPRGPIVVTYVYCGRVTDPAQKKRVHLLVEFSRWWSLTSLGLPVRAKDGVRIPTLRQLLDGRQTWREVQAWASRAPLDPRVTGSRR
jgi:hypothetical protein